MRHAKNKKNRKLTTRNIAYKSTKHPRDRLRELTVNVARGEIVDARYAAAMVAVRTGIPLAEVSIVTITGTDE
ncbi:MAG: hypothetical protein ACRDSM_02015 [Pseudonocardiaceae bacterium]